MRQIPHGICKNGQKERWRSEDLIIINIDYWRGLKGLPTFALILKKASSEYHYDSQQSCATATVEHG